MALPTALMGLAAIPGGRFVDRIGPRMILTAGLALVAIAGGLRAIAPGYALLILFTALFGIGIGIAQPSLPRLGLSLMPLNAGVATGIYAAGFFSGAVTAAFLTPLILTVSNSASEWRLPLAIWGLVALLSLAIWLAVRSSWSHPVLSSTSQLHTLDNADPDWTPWRDRNAWIVTLIFSGQGLAYYLLLAWLPSVYEDQGLSERTAGLLFALFNIATLPAMLGLPMLSDRIGSRRIPTLVAALFFLAGSIGLAFAADAEYGRWLWTPIAALGVAGLFAMGLLMPIDVAPPGKTGLAAGMVLCVGYLAAALGPIVGGAIKDATGSFEDALRLLPLLALAMVICSLAAPRPFSRRS